MHEPVAKELPIPVSKTDHPEAIEILRVWADESQYVTLNPDFWDDPAAWGIMLVDVARHVANAYKSKNRCPVSETLARIKQGFDAEWSEPTDIPEGGIADT